MSFFYIMNRLMGTNLFKGSTAPNLDILNFSLNDMMDLISSKVVFTVKSVRQISSFGRAIEGLFMPVKIVYYTL